MQENILIVEDEFIIANDLSLLLAQSGLKVCGIAASVAEARGLLIAHRIDIVLLDIFLKGELTGIDLAHELRRDEIPFVYLSANSNQQVLELVKQTDPAGFLVKPFREKDVLVTLDIARYRHANRRRPQDSGREHVRDALQAIASSPDEQGVHWTAILGQLQAIAPFSFCSVTTYADPQEQGHWQGFRRTGLDEYQELGVAELAIVTKKTEPEIRHLLATQDSDRTPSVALNCETALRVRDGMRALLAKTFSLESELTFPLLEERGKLFVLSLFAGNPDAYHPEDLVKLLGVQAPLRQIAGRYQQRSAMKVREAGIGQESDRLEGSAAMDAVLALVAQVGPTDTTVLVLGESGTGKERVADRLHSMSPRSRKPLVKVNCAALPANLIESELFGHEKGAFTGATERKQGKFELANGGSIFLDEIGEMSLDQQVKLLRVLQEREVERIGGRERIRLDVRVIAATNRNLEKEVAEGRFRLDLYYRLNVFPVQLPPLRERVADIPLLAQFFATNFCKKMNKRFAGIGPEALAEMQSYAWPGNVRELENVMEQAVILNDGNSPICLRRSLGNCIAAAPIPQTLDDIQALHRQSEKAYIAAILRKTKGRVRGAGGAAELLQEKPTTLESRMLKLGIRKEEFLD